MYMHIILCIHFNVTIVTVLVTHSCVWIVAGLVVFVLYSFSSLTFDALYIYTYHASQNSPAAWINDPTCCCHAEPCLRTIGLVAVVIMKPHCM